MGTHISAVPKKSEDNCWAKKKLSAFAENKQARGRGLGRPVILNTATGPLCLRYDFSLGKNGK